MAVSTPYIPTAPIGTAATRRAGAAASMVRVTWLTDAVQVRQLLRELLGPGRRPVAVPAPSTGCAVQALPTARRPPRRRCRGAPGATRRPPPQPARARSRDSPLLRAGKALPGPLVTRPDAPMAVTPEGASTIAKR